MEFEIEECHVRVNGVRLRECLHPKMLAELEYTSDGYEIDRLYLVDEYLHTLRDAKTGEILSQERVTLEHRIDDDARFQCMFDDACDYIHDHPVLVDAWAEENWERRKRR